MRSAVTKLVSFRRQFFRFFHLGDAVGAGQDQAPSRYSQAFAHEKPASLRVDVLQYFQSSHGIERLLCEGQGLVSVDHNKIGIIAIAIDITAGDLDTSRIKKT